MQLCEDINSSRNFYFLNGISNFWLSHVILWKSYLSIYQKQRMWNDEYSIHFHYSFIASTQLFSAILLC